MPISMKMARWRNAQLNLHEVTPGGVAFGERVVQVNRHLSSLDLMARKPVHECSVVQQSLETYENVSAAAFSHDAMWLLYGAYALKLVSVFTGEVTELLPLGLGLPMRDGTTLDQVRCVCFSTDSSLCCAGRGDDLVCFDVTARTEYCCLRGADAAIVACVIAPRVACGVTERGTIHVWRDVGVHGAQPPLRIDSAPIGLPPPSTEGSPYLVVSGDRILAGGAHGLFCCWSADTPGGFGAAQRIGDALGVIAVSPCGPRQSQQHRTTPLGDAPLDATTLPRQSVANDAWSSGGVGNALVLCTEADGHVHVRDARTGASVHRVASFSPPPSLMELRACAVGVESARTLLTLTGFQCAQLHDTLGGRRVVPPTLGPSLGLAGWLSRVATCALAPDDSAIVGLSVSRHGATGLFVIRIDEATMEDNADQSFI